MHKIRLKILLLTLVPSACILGLLSFYLLNLRAGDLEGRFLEHGELTARQLANAALNGVLSSRTDILELLAEETRRNDPAISAIRITGPNDLTLVEVGTPIPSTPELRTRFSSRIAPAYDIKQLYLYLLQQPLLAGEDGRPDLGRVIVWQDPSNLIRQRSVVVRNTILLALIGLAVIALLSIFFSRQIARPLEQLTQAARQLRIGRLDARVPTTGQGEVGELQAAFNEMAEEIATASENLQAQVEQATRDLQESLETLEIKNVELDLARQRALQANRVKSEFLASMSHEIRTPMNGVLGFTSLLRRTGLTATQREYLDTIESSAGNLLAIINDILDLSKLEAGKLNLEHRPFSIRRCVDDTLSLLAPQAHQKGLELVAFVYDDVPDEFLGDRTRVAQILTNLVNNAIKFTAKGEVVVRLMVEQEEERSVRLAMNVTDTGVGIPSEEQSHIFETFAQGRMTRIGSRGGTGLGLSICKRLTQMMGGTIKVRSEVGKGSTFVCTLQLEKSADSSPPRVEPALRGMRVLLLEDHPASRRALSGLLQQLGIQATVPDSPNSTGDLQDCEMVVLCAGGDALRHAQELCHRIRSLSREGRPVLLLASTSDQEQLTNLLRCGASASLSKPVRAVALRNLLVELRGGALPHPQPDAVGAAVGDSQWLAGKTLLVADDNAINRRLMQLLLEQWGANVVSAEDGRQALALAGKQWPDLALLDVHMPHLDGYETAAALRARPNGDKLPLIAMTADAMWKNRQQLRRSGFDAYLIKPIEEQELSRLLRKHLFPSIPTAKETESSEKSRSLSPFPADKTPPVRDRAQALRIAGGAERIAANLFAEFLESLPKELSAIHALLDEKKWEELWQAVHRLKGAAAVCGIPAFSAALVAFQQAVQEEDATAAHRRLAAMETEKERLIQISRQNPELSRRDFHPSEVGRKDYGENRMA